MPKPSMSDSFRASPHDPLRGVLLMVLASLSFAIMNACLKAALVDLPYYEGVFVRSLVSAVIIGFMVRRRRLPFFGHARGLLLSRSIFGFIAMNCGFYALSRIRLADATLLHHTAPLFVALFSVVLLSERVTRQLLLLLGLAFVGVMLVIKPSFEIANVPGMIGLLGGAFAGLAYVHVRQLHQTEHTWVIAFHFTSFSSIASLPLMLIAFKMPNAVELTLLVAAGLCGTIGQLFMTHAYRHDLASRLAPYGYSSVLFSVFFGLWFFAEIPDMLAMVGIALVVCAGIGIYRQPASIP